jgi:hypothetical protein
MEGSGVGSPPDATSCELDLWEDRAAPLPAAALFRGSGMLSCFKSRTVKRRARDWSFIWGTCFRPKYSQTNAMQCTRMETAMEDGSLWKGGGSEKRVVIREDPMNG